MPNMLHKAPLVDQASAGSPSGGQRGRTIEDGDLVILYLEYNSMSYARVKSGQTTQNRFGLFKHQDWIGKPFGSRVTGCKEGMGYMYLLAPTPELWTKVLGHRTQILYAGDIALICAQLELRPGCTVLESGTGSGSLTHSLARAVAPTGRVYTFEYHEQRCGQARQEFLDNGLGDVVEVAQRDIQLLGFPEDLHGKADAVFLDLPGPWEAVASAAQCLRPDGVFCGFSPCIEQVQRTAEALARNGFWGTRTLEVLLRDYDVRTETLSTDPFADAEENEKGRRKRKHKHNSEGPGAKKRKLEDAAPAVMANLTPTDATLAVMTNLTPSAVAPAVTTNPAPSDAAPAVMTNPSPSDVDGLPRQTAEVRVVTRPVMLARGHTGYLTFARRIVDVPENEIVVDPDAE